MLLKITFVFTECSSNGDITSTNTEEASYGVDAVTMELDDLYTITMIRTQGYNGNWIKWYKVYFSRNNVEWALYREEGVPRVSLQHAELSYLQPARQSPVSQGRNHVYNLTAWSTNMLGTCHSHMTKECNWKIINMSVIPFVTGGQHALNIFSF